MRTKQSDLPQQRIAMRPRQSRFSQWCPVVTPACPITASSRSCHLRDWPARPRARAQECRSEAAGSHSRSDRVDAAKNRTEKNVCRHATSMKTTVGCATACDFARSPSAFPAALFCLSSTTRRPRTLRLGRACKPGSLSVNFGRRSARGHLQKCAKAAEVCAPLRLRFSSGSGRIFLKLVSGSH
jgi:hypothetical protein